MRKFFPIIIGIILIIGFYYLTTVSRPADNTCRSIDQMILSEFNQLKSDYAQSKISSQLYLERLSSLNKKEGDLFNEVRQHKFDNITEYNYWHRGRLKFSSDIKQELVANKKETKEIQ